LELIIVLDAEADLAAGAISCAHCAGEVLRAKGRHPADRPDDRAGRRPAARGPRIMILQLLQAGLFQPGEQLYWPRVREGVLHTATLTVDGCLQPADGARCPDSSAALTAGPAQPPGGGRHAEHQRLEAVAARL